MEPSKPPRVFISYSWESEDHKSWVRYLGEQLCEVGIEVRLDQWFVQPGESFTAFMEKEVVGADFVIVVCTPSYAHKSNNRQGGVGYEQQIVSGQLMSGTARSKFVPILRKGDYEPGPDCAIPTHFLGISWIEFRNNAAFKESLENLIRVIFSKPRFAPPPLGVPPLKLGESIQSLSLFRTFLQRKKTIVTLISLLLVIAVFSAVLLSNGGDTDGGNRIRKLVQQGKGHIDEAEFAAAMADYNKAIMLKPDDADAYNNRGFAYFAKGDRDRAIADYNKAIELKPDFVDAYNNRGFAYFANAKGDSDRAIEDYNKAIELKPDFADAYNNRGFAYFAKGDTDRAIEDYNKAIELKPDFADAYSYRGIAYSVKGDTDRGIADYNRAIELKPDKADAYYNRGIAYSAKGDKDRAIDDFRESLELFTDPADRESALRELRRLEAK